MTILSWLDPGPTALRLSLLVLIQISAVVLLAWAIASLPTRKPAAARDALWFAALLGVVLGPVFLIVLHTTGLTVGILRPLVPTVQTPTYAETTRLIDRPQHKSQPVSTPTNLASDRTSSQTELGSSTEPLPDASTPGEKTFSAWLSRSTIERVALGVWLGGSSLMFGWLVFGLWALARLRLDARPVTDPRYQSLLKEAARAVGLRSTPLLLSSNRLSGPVAVGIRRPTILMPAHVLESVDETVLLDVLIHESAHLRRLDPLIGLVQRVALALFWPHPLVHLLNRELTQAREETCDNHVLRVGNRTRYARTLLALADSIQGSPRALIAAGLLPARWRLADRVAGLLDDRRDLMIRVPLRRFGGLAALIVLASAPFAVLGPERTQAQTQTEASPTPKPASTPDEAPISEMEIAGRVVDADGTPIEGATVDAFSWFPGQETTTDANGRFRFRVFDGHAYDPDWGAEMRISHEGYAPRTFESVKGGTSDLRVELDNTTYFEGAVLAPDGSPVPDILIRASNPRIQEGRELGRHWTETQTDPNGHYRLYVETSTFDLIVRKPGLGVARLSDERIEKGQSKHLDLSVEKGIDFRARVVDSLTDQPVEGLRLYRQIRVDEGDFEGRSDPDGLVRIDDLPPGPVDFQVDLSGYARWWSEQAVHEWQRKMIGELGMRYGPWQRNFDDLSYEIAPGMEPVTIVVEKAVTIRGRVLDPEGNPVSGATVAPALTGTGNSLTGDARFSVKTHEDGTYEMLLPASGEHDYNLVAHDGDYREWRHWANGVIEPFRTKPGEVLEDIDIPLTRPASVRGRIVSPSGDPVAGREVGASAADKKGNRYYDPTSAVTDADGRFELKFIRPGEQYIQVAPFWLFAEDAPKGTSQTVTLKPGEVREGIELTAQPQ